MGRAGRDSPWKRLETRGFKTFLDVGGYMAGGLRLRQEGCAERQALLVLARVVQRLELRDVRLEVGDALKHRRRALAR